MPRPIKLKDLAEKLGISIGTIDRALHGRPGINAETRKRILEAAEKLGYRRNMAASILRTGSTLRIGVVLPLEIASFWSEVRSGIVAEQISAAPAHTELIEFPFARLGKGQENALNAALKAKVQGIITIGGPEVAVQSALQKAADAKIPVVFVGSIARNLPGLANVSINPQASGSLAAELIARSHPEGGGVIVALGDRRIPDHAEKLRSFETTLAEYYPQFQVLATLETHDDAAEAERKMKKELVKHKHPVACYITTANSLPVIAALSEKKSAKLPCIIATDIFPELSSHIQANRVSASLHQRPRTQGVIAFRYLYNYLTAGAKPDEITMLHPQVIFRSNLKFFL